MPWDLGGTHLRYFLSKVLQHEFDRPTTTIDWRGYYWAVQISEKSLEDWGFLPNHSIAWIGSIASPNTMRFGWHSHEFLLRKFMLYEFDRSVTTIDYVSEQSKKVKSHGRPLSAFYSLAWKIASPNAMRFGWHLPVFLLCHFNMGGKWTKIDEDRAGWRYLSTTHALGPVSTWRISYTTVNQHFLR